MNNFSDSIDYALKAPQMNQDIQDTLKSILKISMKYHEDDTNLKQFFKSVQPKINYLFWLFQNVENVYLEEQLSELFEQYDDMKQKYKLSKKHKYSFASLQEEQLSVALENSVLNYDAECLL